MKVILTEEVPNVGAAGDLVNVASGYARNYLLPRNLAIEATRGNVKALAHHRRTIEARQQKLATGAQALGERVTAAPITISAKAGEAGRLYGSVTAADIAEEVQRARGLEVDKRKVDIPEPIKVLGEHEVKVRLHRDVQVALTVNVIAEGPPPEAVAAGEGEPAVAGEADLASSAEAEPAPAASETDETEAEPTPPADEQELAPEQSPPSQ